PGDTCWPSDADFAALNATISGHLLRGVPPASVCYADQPNYDQSACEQVRMNWFNADFHAEYSVSISFPYWADNPCPPIFPNGTSVTGDVDAGRKGCSIGKYPAYVVNATGYREVQAAFKFAARKGIRVNVKSTGISLQGRSTAFGSLSIWTRYIKGIQIYSAFQAEKCASAGSSAAAIVAAGETVRAIYEAAGERDMIVVAGLSQHVGIVGWVTGGGHGPLSSTYGMGVDNVLEVKMVTPNGDYLTANACQNTDLFWAVRGGGGGTFGVITEVTMKAFPSPTITTHDLSIAAQRSTTDSTWWKLVAEIHSHLPSLKEGGLEGYIIMTPSVFTTTQTNTFTWTFSLYNRPNGTIESLLKPVIQFLDANNSTITYTTSITHPSSFLAHWLSGLGPEPVASSAVSSGSRLLPASVFSSEDSIAAFATALENISAHPSDAGPPILQSHMIANSANRGLNISLVSAWRDAVVHFVIGEGFADSVSHADAKVVYARQTARTEFLRIMAPKSGAYLNECDPFSPQWQNDFWGDNYERLKRVKIGVDRTTALWCVSCVGGEGWVSKEDGRLCKADTYIGQA
ncbi:FAD binding domain-containing protein, partial [Boeremia exigua]|uniref:FAD binding domain-containing protein n=1 Tax=Boeremia exigua TaxID=749465 RepID=UPI001E8E540B